MQISAEGGNHHLLGILVKAQIQLPENGLHLLRGDIRSQQAVDPLRLKGHPYGLILYGIDIDHASHHFAAAQLLYQLAGPVDGCLRVVGIQALLKNGGCIRPESCLLCGQTDIHAVKVSGFKYDGMYMIRDLGVLASHDTCKAHSLFSVIDHQHGVIQLPYLAVQGLELISVRRTLYHDLMTRNGVIVVGMHGLAILLHDEVRDIHQVIDGTDAAVPKALLHPFRGGGKADVLYHPCTVTGAELCILHLYLQIVIDILTVSCFLYLRQLEALSEGGGSLPGNADDAVAVHPV